MRLGNGRWENTEFNSRLQPTKIGLGSGVSSQSLLKLEFSYGTTQNNGNVVSQTITVPGVTHPFAQAYTYDELNRVAIAEETQNSSQTWKQTFTYDRYGNRNFNTSGSNTTTLPSGFDPDIYNPTISTTNNRFSSGQGYSYDSSGNTTADAEGRTFVYDAENKQIEVIESSTTIGQYFYDGDGKRIKKYVPGGETTIFVYDATGKQISEYSTIVQSSSDAKITYTTNDHLGSPRINTDTTGQVISRHDYHPFGEEIARTGYGSDTIRKQFTGYERDGETGLDFAQSRMYGGGLGRFSTPDPYNVILEKERGEDDDERADILIGFISNPQRWNMYVYVVNNPLAFTDPDGQKPRTINVFLSTDVASSEQLKEWQDWATSAQKKDKELTINIYQISAANPRTVDAFIDSLKAKDTATIFMGHSAGRRDRVKIGILFDGAANVGSRSERGVTHSVDGVDIQNNVVAIFSCDFGNGFKNIASSNGAAFVSIIQGTLAGAHKTTTKTAVNASAFEFTKSIANGSWNVTTFGTTLDIARSRGQSGINANPHPDPNVNAGDYVHYRILQPPRKKK